LLAFLYDDRYRIACLPAWDLSRLRLLICSSLDNTFFAGNWALSFGFSGLGKGAGIGRLKVRGAFYDRPLSSVLLLVGLLTLIGFPLTAGYASNLSILSVTWNANRLIAITILISQILILATGVRFLPTHGDTRRKRITIPEKVNLKQA
jgi:hypothetical protein